jgi:hypothetical protein
MDDLVRDMRWRCVIVSMVIGATAIGAGAGRAEDSFADAGEGWVRYRNSQYGFRFDYADSIFAADPAPQAQDGRSFRSRDGRASMTVFGAQNTEGESLARLAARYLEAAGNPLVTYRRPVRNGLVVSGFQGGNIFYLKIVSSPPRGERVAVIELKYPKEWKRRFDPVVTRSSLSFRLAE